jgi:hypothetical protein
MERSYIISSEAVSKKREQVRNLSMWHGSRNGILQEW